MAALQIATRMPFNGRTIEYGGKEGGKEPCTCVAAFSETQAVVWLFFACCHREDSSVLRCAVYEEKYRKMQYFAVLTRHIWGRCMETAM